jgi:ArsR family transcriptional regulator
VDVLQLFGEPTRVRLTAILAQRELTVAELTAITSLPQSRVSTHLGRLREAGVLRDRRAGASTFYSLNEAAMPAAARAVWELVSKQLADETCAEDRARADEVVKRRAAAWPDAVAGEMERHWSPGRTWESLARGLVGLVRLGDVLDAGSGDGTIAQLLAPQARSITCVDASARMIDAARRRLAGVASVACRRADLHALPFADASFDQVLMFHVLTDAASPPRVLAEAARVLRPGGGLAVITLDAHDHLDVTAAYHHRHPGFAPSALRRMFTRAGLVTQACEVTSRERRAPHLKVVTAFAHKGTSP